MTALYALYDAPEAAQNAVDGLRAAGVPDRNITILSSRPLEGYEMGQRDHHTPMSWIASAGGLVGCLIGVALTSLTQLDWPLETGGMPIVSVWPNLIPIFELTLLGAVLAAVGTFILSALAPSNRSAIYDPAVSDGKILIGLEHPEQALSEDLEKAFGPDGEVKRVP